MNDMNVINRVKGFLSSTVVWAAAVAVLLLGVEAATLPAGYLAVDYIESTGAQYVNTELNLNGTDKITARIAFTDLSLDAQGVFCTRANDGSAATREFAVLYKNVLAMCQTTSDILRANASPFVVNEPKAVVFDGDAKALTLDGTRQDLTFTGSSDFTATTPLFLFAMRSNGNPATWSKMRLYAFTVTDRSGAIRADFMPCVKVEGDVETAGLYDTMREKFYPSASSTALRAAPHFTLPSSYQEAEFLQVFVGSGGMKMDFVPNRTDRIEMDFAFTTFPQDRSIPCGVFCARDDQGTVGTRLMFHCADGVLKGSYGSDYVSSAYAPQIHERLRTVYDGKKRQIFVNGDAILSFANDQTANFSTTARMNLFALGDEAQTDFSSELRFYGLKVYDETGSLRAQLVPCHETSTGGSGAYDLVNRRFYPVTGAAAPNYTLPPEYEELAYIESTGAEYIDLGLSPYGDHPIEARISFTDVTPGGQGVFCSRKDSTDMNRIMCVLYAGGTMRQFYQQYEYLSDVVWKVGDIHTVRMDGRTGEFSIDGAIGHTFDHWGFACEPELRLFALNSGAGAKMRLYSFLFLNNNGLYRNKLYPARRVSDGVVGLYCVNRHMFFTNKSGKGGFRAGPKVTNRWLVEPSITKTAWTTEERPGVLDGGRTMAGETSCTMTAADLLTLGPGAHEITFSVPGEEGRAPLEHRLTVTVREPDTPSVDPGDISVVAVRNGSAIVGAKLAFPAASASRECWVVWSSRDAGSDPAAWTNSRKVDDIAAGATAAEVSLPEPLISGGFRVVLAFPLTAKDYVQDGLVVQYDGIENAGPGVHLPSIGAWRNLKARTDATDAPTHYGDLFEPDAVNLGLAARTTSATVLPSNEKGPMTVEVNAKPMRTHLIATLESFVSVSGRGGFGWSGPERPGAVTTWRVDASDVRHYRTFETEDFKSISNLIDHGGNPYRTYSVLLTPAEESVGVNGEAMIRTDYRYNDPVKQSEAALTLGSDTVGAKLRSVRVYNRSLTVEEKAHNLAVDAARFDGAAPLAKSFLVSDYARVKTGLIIVIR